ncbi:hypothetical protein CWS02_01560 [Enterobacter sp. EA-1]|nr:hypothetical protein CWS02_01560 [Enterobacter sp. EA-1]
MAAILKKKGFGDMSDATAALAGTRHKTEVSNQQYAAQQAQAEAERAQAASKKRSSHRRPICWSTRLPASPAAPS